MSANPYQRAQRLLSEVDSRTVSYTWPRHLVQSLARDVIAMQERIDAMTEALTLIRDTDPIDAALDPQRAVRVATEVLATKCAHCGHAIEKDRNGTWLHSVTFDGRLRAEACEPDMQSMYAQPVDM